MCDISCTNGECKSVSNSGWNEYIDETWKWHLRFYPDRKNFFRELLENFISSFGNIKLQQDNKLKCMKMEVKEE